MSDENTEAKKQEKQDEEPELPLPWKQIQSAIWLIGLAILFWKGWFWPGILVLTAISGVSQPIAKRPRSRRYSLSLRLLETACGPRTTMQSPLRWQGPADWRLDYLNVERLSAEELARLRAENDHAKEVAKNIRATTLTEKA